MGNRGRCHRAGGAAFAQENCSIEVLAYSSRPGGPNIPEAYVHVRNRGQYYCRVRVDRETTNPQPHQSCTNCTTPGCGTAPEGNTVCHTANTNENIELSPCTAAVNDYCKSVNDCMPGAGSIGAACCDCKTNSGSCNGVCAGTSGEFCSRYGNVLVTLTGEKAPGHGQQWQSLDAVVCASGSYHDTYPDAPECPIQSYCDDSFGSRSYRAPCTQLGSLNNCVQ